MLQTMGEWDWQIVEKKQPRFGLSSPHLTHELVSGSRRQATQKFPPAR